MHFALISGGMTKCFRRFVSSQFLIELRCKGFNMPVKKVKSGYRFGKHGKTYKTKTKAKRQARAIFASGWKEKKK